MSIPTNEFIIAVFENDVAKRYYAIDRDIGANFSEYFSSAYHFKNKEEVTEVLTDLLEKAKNPRPANSSGVIEPQQEIYEALGLHREKNLKATVKISILELRLHAISSIEVTGEIKKPTGFKYD